MAKKRSVIIVEGYVQMSGFRSEVEKLARSHSLNGKVENLKNSSKDVQIDIEGEEENVTEFIKNLEEFQKKDKKENEKKYGFDVSEISIEPQTRLMNYFTFEVVRKPDETAERLDEGIEVIREVKSEISGLHEQYGTINTTMGKVNTSLNELNDSLREVSGLKTDLHELKDGIKKLTALPGSVDRLNKNLILIVDAVLKKGKTTK